MLFGLRQMYKPLNHKYFDFQEFVLKRFLNLHICTHWKHMEMFKTSAIPPVLLEGHAHYMGTCWIFHEAPPHATEKFQERYIQRIHYHNNKRNASSFPYISYAVTRLFTLIILKQQMFTPDQTGRQASPHLDLEKTVCGSCAICKLHLNSSADPRLLPCLHTVCNTCLTKICTDGATQGKDLDCSRGHSLIDFIGALGKVQLSTWPFKNRVELQARTIALS